MRRQTLHRTSSKLDRKISRINSNYSADGADGVRDGEKRRGRNDFSPSNEDKKQEQPNLQRQLSRRSFKDPKDVGSSNKVSQDKSRLVDDSSAAAV
jgi:hypothetical protein